jgi:hypothetical protein
MQKFPQLFQGEYVPQQVHIVAHESNKEGKTNVTARMLLYVRDEFIGDVDEELGAISV